MVYSYILDKIKQGEKIIAILLDPDKYSESELEVFIERIKQSPPQLILVGGSLISTPLNPLADYLKGQLEIPVVLYPGSPSHLTSNIDAVLFLSMISGRNPELLIGNHVEAAPYIYRHQLETISTGYMLIAGGNYTSVEYMSQTRPIPSEKNDIAIATALAGEMLGMKMIYMDAGSGAARPVPSKMIKEVRQHIKIPLMIGGGITSAPLLKDAFDAGADIAVVGNVLEKDPTLIKDFVTVAKG